METVTSKDGTTIAYDRYGSGPPVILAARALGFREFKKMEELARLLAERCSVINYDRRGRGDSTEVTPVAPDREIEDIAALIEAEGGSASFGAGRRAAPWRYAPPAPASASSDSRSTRCRSWSTLMAGFPRGTTGSGSTSWLPPATAAAP
jgi:hypothetical protein